MESVIRGHHVYSAIWTPMIGEYLEVCRELENLHDRRAVCIKKRGVIVGHVPRELISWITVVLSAAGCEGDHNKEKD